MDTHEISIEREAGTYPYDAALAEKILAYVRETGDRSFVEMEREFPDDFGQLDDDGSELALGMWDLNIVLWIGLSPRMMGTLRQLQNDGQLHLYPTNVLVYLADGKCYRMPLVKRPPKNGYKDVHWLPVVLKPGPFPDD